MIDLAAPLDYVVHGEAADVLPTMPDGSFQLISIDPPFNTGKVQERRVVRTDRTTDGVAGDRTGFNDRRYTTTEVSRISYADIHDDYLGWLAPHLHEARRLLRDDGTLYLHVDPRESHYCKVLLDEIFGRECFLNEVIWAYDYGGRKKDRWAQKHDTILVYVKVAGAHHFATDEIDRIPYMAPGLVSAAKRERGKLPTDVWWHTIVPTRGKEKTGYPNQKPEGIVRRIVAASSAEGERVLDFFAGSGTTGAVARELGRRFVLVDRNPEAIDVIQRRLPGDDLVVLGAPADAAGGSA